MTRAPPTVAAVLAPWRRLEAPARRPPTAQSGAAAARSSISLSFAGGIQITVGDQATLAGSLTFSDGSPADGLSRC